MLHTILKILRLLLQHQVELSNKIDDLQNKNLPEYYITPTETNTVDEIVGELELLESTLIGSKF
jgi:hypothetical protein